jgi:predicted MPP superfamily phosphohydrolase
MARLLRLLLFVSIVSSFFGGIHYYFWLRLVYDPAWQLQDELTWLFYGLGLLLPVSFLTGRFAPRAVASPVAWVGFLWMGFSTQLLLWLGVAELPRFLLPLLGTFQTEPLSRGLALGAVAVSLGAGLYGMRRALSAPLLREVEIPLQRLPRAFDGFRMVQLSDVHVGATIGRDFVTMLVERCNALRPDLILLTGDMVDGSVENLAQHVAPFLQLQATHGVLFITGNHEYFSGAESWKAHFASLGSRVLSNERIGIVKEGEVLEFAGIEDIMAPNFGGISDLGKALAGRDSSKPVVLLSHQPMNIKEAVAAGVDLQISGHTHGGQFFPFRWAAKLVLPAIEGLYEFGNTKLYVSQGTGYWGPPMRIGTHGEISLLTLRCTS